MKLENYWKSNIKRKVDVLMEWIAIIFFGLIIMSVISSKMQDNVRRKYSKTIKKVIIVSNDSRKKSY